MQRIHAAHGRRLLSFLAVAAALATLPWMLAQPLGDGWVTVEYGDLVDQRRLSHSGEPVGALLDRLGGRPVPRPGERPGDAVAHVLLDPLLEPYAFVLPDTIDAGSPAAAELPFVDVGRLYAPGEARPAWADLLRDGRFIVESDGAGRVRAFVPVASDTRASAESAREGWRRAWPVLRHVLAAVAGATRATDGLDVTAYPFVHKPARTEFRLGLAPHTERVTAFGPDGERAPVDLEGWRALLAGGLQLEGGRLAPDGSLTLMASRPAERPGLAGRPLDLSDVAVAYRAVFHAPGDEPYMSLDRAPWPHITAVNYGGRLGDTTLGLVSLLCDIRFKTFSVGQDVTQARDVRDDVRKSIARFATHLERLAADPAAAGVSGQQTRLWFYPDTVEMTLSPAGDLMALRRARMAAASERADPSRAGGGARPDPSWTRETVRAIDADYDALAKLFPEMADLDQVVRLLSLFAWLRGAEVSGARVPDLGVLLAETLPALSTPREYPQLLTFNALPPVGGSGAVEALARAEVVESLDRVRPADGQALPPAVRFERARSLLEPRLPEHARLLSEIASIDPGSAGDTVLDLFAHRAERLAMHRLVLGTLPLEQRRRLGQRQLTEGRLRVFSVGIGGLDLSMAKAVKKASGRPALLRFGGAGALGVADSATRPAPPATGGSRSGEAFTPPPSWKTDPAGLARTTLPSHGMSPEKSGRVSVTLPGGSLIGTSRPRRHVARASLRLDAGTVTLVETIHDAASPDMSARRLVLGEDGRARAVTRREGARVLHFRVERIGEGRMAARRSPPALPASVTQRADAWFIPPVPGRRASRGGGGAGLVFMTFAGDHGPASETIPVVLEASGERRVALDVPRPALRAAAAGPGLVEKGAEPAAPLVPLPRVLSDAARVLIVDRAVAGDRGSRPGWSSVRDPLPGEEDASNLARGLSEWLARGASDPGSAPRAGIAADAARAGENWSRARTDGAPPRLVVPRDALTGRLAAQRERLVAAWTGPSGPFPETNAELPSLVVVVSDEAPSRLAARLDDLAGQGAMDGRSLVIVTLGRPIRGDLPARLLDRGRLAAVGVIEAGPTGLPATIDAIAALGRAAGAAPRGTAVDTLARGAAWHF